jgi:hypothetical protein
MQWLRLRPYVHLRFEPAWIVQAGSDDAGGFFAANSLRTAATSTTGVGSAAAAKFGFPTAAYFDTMPHRSRLIALPIRQPKRAK